MSEKGGDGEGKRRTFSLVPKDEKSGTEESAFPKKKFSITLVGNAGPVGKEIIAEAESAIDFATYIPDDEDGIFLIIYSGVDVNGKEFMIVPAEPTLAVVVHEI